MARTRKKYIDYLQYLALRLFAAFVHMFDVRTNYRTARWIGEILWRIDRRHRRIACEHLRLSFPDWPEDRILRVARKSIYNMAYLAIEVLFTPRLITPNRWRRHIRPKDIGEALRLLVRQETGMILLTGHFGNWEVLGYMMATLGFPTVSVARPLDNPYVNEFLMGVRERTGQSILHKKGAASSAAGILRRRGALAFIADQDAGRRGLFVDFFGRPASTYRSIGVLARQFNVPIAVGYGKRLSNKFEFEAGIKRIIHPSEWADQEDEITWITQEFTRELEEIVREAPEQYLWVHRRWKHRPDGSKAPGDGVA